MGLHTPTMFKAMTPRLLRVYMLASMGAINFGYDNNWWSGVITLDNFIQDYGKKHGPGQPRTLPSSWLSAASGTPLAGWILGCAVAGFLTRRYGRKMTLYLLCCIGIVGCIIQSAVPNYWALMVGRLINSVSMGIEANTVPMYMAELAPPSIRGGLVNIYQSWLTLGAIVSGGAVYGSYLHLSGKWVYLTPIIIGVFPTVLLLMAVPTLPESPRWLLFVNRKEEAYKALKYMRKGASTDEEVAHELELLSQAIDEEVEMHHATQWADCFKGTNLRRTMIAIGVQCLQQAQGNSFTQSYLVIFLGQVGVDQPLMIKMARSCASWAGTLMAFYLTDKLGRRFMLMGGAVLGAAALWVTSGIAAWTPGGASGSSANAAIAMIFIQAAVASGTWGSVMWAVTVEVSTQQLREKTISIATICGFVVSLLITFINPYMQNEPGNLGARVGMIYGSFGFAACVFVYFLVPEMRGRSLEELDELFRSGVPAWRSRNFVGHGVGAQITRAENAELAAADMKAADHEETEVPQRP